MEGARGVALAGGRYGWPVDLPGDDLPPNEGSAADAIRGAETALARQTSAAAHVDLQVVTAVLNAHVTTSDGTAELVGLQREIETAVLSRTDLDTPAGAREFQRYLIGKLRDIRTVVDTAGLDATSKAALAAALASLYASASPATDDTGPPERTESQPAQPLSEDTACAEPARGSAEVVAEPLADDYDTWEPADLPLPIPAEQTTVPPPQSAPVATPAPALAAPAMSAPPPGQTSPSWGGGLPALGGISSPDLPAPLSDRPGDSIPDRAEPRGATGSDPEEEAPGDTAPESNSNETPPEDPAMVHLPDGTTVSAPSAEVAAAMTAALAGTPIPEAFRQVGLAVPSPGTAVPAPVNVTDLMPGDIGVLTDRHALALGNGKALLDNQIQPIASVIGPGFLGWQHPPVPGPTTQTTPTIQMPQATPPNRPAETAPS